MSGHHSFDPQRVRRETMRWNLLLGIYHARPSEIFEGLLLSTMQAINPDATAIEVRQQLDYLAHRELVELRKEPSGRWWATLTSDGVDIVEYTSDCDPGIARPKKYWGEA